MLITRTTLTLLLLAFSTACTDLRADKKRSLQSSSTSIDPAPADAPSALTFAHEAYLAGDYVEMGERLKDVLLDPRAGELAKDNAYALLESAYAAKEGTLPARATLPKSVRSITFGVLNGGNPYGPNRNIYLTMRVDEGRGAHVKDMRVSKLIASTTSEPILSLSEKRGVFRTQRTSDGEGMALDEAKIDLKMPDVLPERGVFSIQVTFDDDPPGQAAINSFILADKLIATTQPEVSSPTVNQVFNTPHPEIAWEPYRSPQYASWETRALWIGISTNKRASGDELVWDLYKWQPPTNLVTATPTKTLAPDSYWLSILCTEQRVFGNIHISRTTESGRPFSVVAR